ncbi:MAG: substrate-binding domain-containing protein [Anaerolineae bacterium]
MKARISPKPGAMPVSSGCDPRPTAVFAANDLAIRSCRIQAAGLRVPDDLAIVGFDDIPAAATSAWR